MGRRWRRRRRALGDGLSQCSNPSTDAVIERRISDASNAAENYWSDLGGLHHRLRRSLFPADGLPAFAWFRDSATCHVPQGGARGVAFGPDREQAYRGSGDALRQAWSRSSPRCLNGKTRLRRGPWILARSATGSREADLGVFAKLFEDRLEGRLEAETFSRR
jgi:hypothetical protein